MFTLVVFIHNTVRSYEDIADYQIVHKFIDASRNINERCDLDIRPSFISFSDDVIMVQLIGHITTNVINMVRNAIDDMKSRQ